MSDSCYEASCDDSFFKGSSLAFFFMTLFRFGVLKPTILRYIRILELLSYFIDIISGHPFRCTYYRCCEYFKLTRVYHSLKAACIKIGIHRCTSVHPRAAPCAINWAARGWVKTGLVARSGVVKFTFKIREK